MKEITKKIQELYDMLVVRLNKLDGEKSALVVKKAKVDADAKANEELTKELEVREKDVKKIEDVMKLKRETTEAYTALIAEKKAHKNAVAAFDEKCIKHEETMQEERNAIEAKKQKQIKAELALDKEKKTYKEKVMKEINENIEKTKVKL